MSKSTKLRIICYDISDNRRRRRVAYILEEYASRVQFSVFESRLTDARLRKLMKKLNAVIQGDDSLRVYSISKIGERYCKVYGKGVSIEPDAGYWLF